MPGASMWQHAHQKYACFQNYLLDCFLKGETWAWWIPCTVMKSPLLCQVTLEICISETLAALDSFHRLAEMPGYAVMCVLMRLEVIRELLLGLLNPTQRTHLKWQISQISCGSLCSPPESKGVLETWEGTKRLLGRPSLQYRQDWLVPPRRSHSPTTSHKSQSFCSGPQGPSTEYSISARTQLQTVAPNKKPTRSGLPLCPFSATAKY